MSSLRLVVLVLVVALAGAVLLPSTGLAQGTQTGSLSGTVVDPNGAPVESASVRIVGPQGERTGSTDANGRFRFTLLSIGAYRVSAELPGAGMTSGEASADIFIGRSTEVELELAAAGEPLAAVAETLLVTSEAPLVDRFDATLGGSIRFEFLDDLPLERFYQSVALMLPGVAGGGDGNPEINGGLRSSNIYLVDGVDTTDPTTGLFGLNLTYEAVDEVEVITGGAPAEFGRMSGGAINVVTRVGTNQLQGSARWIATNNDWNDSFDQPGDATDQLADEIAVANSGPDELNDNIALSIGGPLVKDRLWGFAAYEQPQGSFRRPLLEGSPFWDIAPDGENADAKLTWQVTESSSLTGQFAGDSFERGAFQPFDSTPGENSVRTQPGGGQQGRDALFNLQLAGDIFAIEERSQEGSFVKLRSSTILGRSSSLDVGVADQERDLDRDPRTSRGLTSDAPHLDLDRGFVFNGVTQQGREERSRQQANAVFSWFLEGGANEHELRFGADYQETESARRHGVPGRSGIDPLTGNAESGQVFLDFDWRDPCIYDGVCAGFDGELGTFQPYQLIRHWEVPGLETSEEILAVHVADRVELGRLFLSLGVRAEDTDGTDTAGGTIVDATTFAPRVNLSYDLRGTGETVLRAGFNRYYEPFLQKYVDLFDRQSFFSGYTSYQWANYWPGAGDFYADLFGEPSLAGLGSDELFFGLDCAGQDARNIDSFCWTNGFEIDRSPFQQGQANPDIDPSYVDEILLGIEHSFSPTFGGSLTFIDREWDDLWDDVLFAPVFSDPIFADLGDGELVEVVPGGFLEDFQTDYRNVDSARREYQAIQLMLQKRFARNWQLLGSYTWSEAKGNFFEDSGLSTFADFNDVSDVNVVNRFGVAPYDRRHQLKVFGRVLVPFERVDLIIGNAVRYETGLPYNRTEFPEFELYSVDSNYERFINPIGTQRLDDLFQWDLSFGLDVPLRGDFAIEVKGEVFNLTGEDNQIGTGTLTGDAAEALPALAFDQPRSIFDLQAPRSYRVTVGLRF